MAVSRAYVDASYLLDVAMRGRAERTSRGLLSRVSGPGFELVIPQAVLGEALAVILRERPRGAALPPVERLAGLMERYGIDVAACLAPASRRVLEIAAELARRDRRLGGTDAVILAHALADPDSKFFFTRDSRMPYSNAVPAYEGELRDAGGRRAGLRICDGSR